MLPTASCPDAAKWERLGAWQLGGADAEEFAAHVEGCRACASRIEQAAQGHVVGSALRAARDTAADVDQAKLDTAISRLMRLGAAGPQTDENEKSPTKTVTPPPDAALQFGEYRVIRQLGQGGMGIVYEALDENAQRRAAVKVLGPRLCENETARKRFLREGQMLAAVKSEHIVTIYRVAEQDGAPFLAMELLDGSTLADWLQDRAAPITAGALLKVARDLLTGLAAAHAAGLVHRDIKPANLWVEQPTGRVKLIDFGLTRGVEVDHKLTPIDRIVGTPAYMSPEQASGTTAEPRSDLFSAGVTLYRMVAGASPFERDSLTATLGAVVHFTPPPLTGVPRSLSEFIGRLMSKDSSGRPKDAAAALLEVQALERELAAKPAKPDGRPLRGRANWRRWVAAGVVAAAAAVLAGIIIILRDGNGRPLAKLELPDAKAKDVKVEVIDAQSGKTIKLAPVETKPGPAPKQPAKAAADRELRAGAAMVVIAYTRAFNDNSSTAAHPIIEFVEKGSKGTVVEISPETNRCRVRLDAARDEDVWLSLDYVERR